MALPSNISFGTVVGRFVRAVIDGPDEDRDPDGVPIEGLVIRFTPSATVFKNVTAASGPVTILADPIAVTTDENGRLIGPDGVEGIRLIATDDEDLSPSGWTWRVSIQGPGLSQSFSFPLPADSTVDLTTVIPVPPNPGDAVQRWEDMVQNAVDVSKRTLVDANVNAQGELEFTRDNGQTVTAGVVRGPQGEPGDTGPQGLPGVNGVPADEAVAEYVEGPSATATMLENTHVKRTMDGSPRYFPERWYFGPKAPNYPDGLLYMEYHGHFLAQRFAFGGVWDPAIRTAPTIEVIPAAPFVRPDLPGYAEKVGANAINPVSCIQAYAFGHGDTDSRSYFCIEPHISYDSGTETYSGRHVFSSWASGPDGPGVLPVQWRAGNIDAFNVSSGGIVEIQRQLIIGTSALSDGPFQIHRENTNDQPIAQLRQYSPNSLGANVALLKYRGTKNAATPPQLNDILGRISGGTTDGAGSYSGAEIRFLAQENWVNASKRGAKVVMQATKAGTTVRSDVAQFDVPTVVRDTSARLVYWNGSALVEKRVVVGEPDSAGPGFRGLYVTN